MLVVTLVCLVALAALTVVHLRTRSQVEALADVVRDLTGQRDEARIEAGASADDAAAARRDRDDALERVQRARRDAAEVANRLRAESAARADAERAAATATEEGDAVRAEVDQLRADLRSAEEAIAAAPAPGDDGAATAVLWELALGRVERTWRTSVALGADDPSPLDGGDDALRTAVEVLVDAAREEAGADIEIEWSGSGAVLPTQRALLALEVVEAVVATVAKVATRTELRIAVAPDGVEIDVVTDDGAGGPLRLEVPVALGAGPGRFVI